MCDNAVSYGDLVCDTCLASLHKVEEPLCEKCGKPLKESEREFCPDCETRKHYFVKGYALYVYEGAIKKSIYRLKYSKRQEYTEFYGRQIVKRYGKWMKDLKPDALIPVPLYAKKEEERGYNQAKCLCEVISRYTHIPVMDKYVIRVKDTTPQKELDEAERQNNLKKAFKIGQNDVKLKITIIVDDIYTTGSTIDAIAQVLKRAGAEQVYFITLAIGSQM